MKQIYLITILLSCFFATLASGQETGLKTPLSSTQRLSLTRSTAKSTSCGVDTIVYPYLKEMAFTTPADSFFVDAMVGSVRTAAQAYHINDPLQIHGVQFWGGAYSTSPNPQTLQVRAYLYSVDASNQPLNKLDSADVTITNTYDFYEAIFTTPYSYNQNFAVAVRSIPNDTLAVMTNNAGNGWSVPAYGEALAWRRFGSGAWNATLYFFGQDMEYMIFPIVSYDITAGFTTNATTCTDVAAQFDNTSSSNLANRMLNLHAFDEYWNLAAADSTFIWDNDGITQTAEDITYTFSTAGSNPVSVTAEMLGYYTSCSDTYTEGILVTETPVASLNPSAPVVICDGETVELSALPATGVTYQWLMEGVEEADSVTVNYVAGESGNYAVIVSNVCGIDTSDAVSVVVNPLPQVPVISANGVYLIASPAGGVLQWYLDGTEIFGEANDSIMVGQNGIYTVVVTNAFDCSSVSADFEVDYAGVHEDNPEFVSVFPNPSSGRFTIKGQDGGNIVISTSEGRLVYSSSMIGTSAMSVDLSGYGSGVYLIHYSGKEGEKTYRAVVCK